MEKSLDLSLGSMRLARRNRLACYIRTLRKRIVDEGRALSAALIELRGLMSSEHTGNDLLVEKVLHQVHKRTRNKSVYVSRCYKLLEKGHCLPRLRLRHP